jgi:hypothetical protein
MRITKFGTITFAEGEGPKIEGWQCEREPDDPAEATTEQLLLGFVITWAKKKFDAAMNDAVMQTLRKAAYEKATKRL